MSHESLKYRDTPTSRGLLLWVVALLVVIGDQALKIWVKTHFYYGESVEITSWFQLVFIQNNGMAFGWQVVSKLLLTLGRITVVVFLLWYLCRIFRNAKARTGYLVCLALVIAGAMGNIIDCVFYGLIFNNPAPPAVATLFPSSGGYGTLFHGLVVDMLYFPLCSWTWPAWIPGIGGEYFVFFSPVFNLADSAVSVGVALILVFYSRQIQAVTFSWPRWVERFTRR